MKTRTLSILSAIALLAPLPFLNSARAEGYVGALLGWGTPFGTPMNVDPDLVLGATAGFTLLPTLSLGVTYQHDGLKTSVGGADYSVDSVLVEANFFSMIGLTGGIHAGPVTTKIGGASDTDPGFGVHLGFDFHLTDRVSVGGAAYLTYVTADDQYETLNLIVPVKYWF